MDFVLRQIEAGDKVTGLKLGDQQYTPLKIFLQKRAKKYHANNLGKTYAIFTSEAKVVGYVTLVCGEVVTEKDDDAIIEDPGLEYAYNTYPAVKIARLAVDERYRGRQLGRELGSPTANIRLQRYRAALNGVFSVSVEGLDRTYEGIANIGIRPTVDGKEPLLEVHIFDFDKDIYGRLLTVRFHHKIREERTFESIDALKKQIHVDIGIAREWFARG